MDNKEIAVLLTKINVEHLTTTLPNSTLKSEQILDMYKFYLDSLEGFGK